EIRTPITPILMTADNVEPQNPASDVVLTRPQYDIIVRNTKRLRQLANDILDVSRIESGTLPYTMKKMGIHAVLLGCVEATRPSVSAGRVSLATVVSPENEDLEIVGDRERLTQVFMNILSNAVKFTKKGRITVETRLVAGGKIEILFSDTGGGIPEDILPKIFNKFVTKKVGEDVAHGTGLGLFICKAIVEAHGGKISAYNNGDGGATFRVELPVSDKAQVAEKVATREKRHSGP
ncbi:MAG TPA: HAMP domain-containing sensor histidine kinase, partial [Nitrososphaera sp.]|nr:HAMP domain-containing sensor histidine kinase [Nitrososphaera sp.]